MYSINASTLAIFADDQVLPERVLNTQEEQHSYLTFYYENDLFNGEDANYTSGGRLSYITPGQPALISLLFSILLIF